MKYKVGDKVRIKGIDWYNENKNSVDNYDVVFANGWVFSKPMSNFCGKELIIEKISHATNPPHYIMKDTMFAWTDEMIEGLVEEEITNIMDEDKRLIGWIKEPNRYRLVPDKDYEIKYDERGFFYLEKKKREYPKTYEECCTVLNTYCGSVCGYNWKLLLSFQQLLICRDAYWKIAGEEMGLGKPWKPDWNSGYFTPAIIYRSGFIQKVEVRHRNAILVFPTKEIRDAFYEIFKESIEQCKELL